MIKAELMSSKKVKELQSIIKEQFGNTIKGVLYKGSKKRIYLGTRFTSLINLRKVNAEGVGLYIGKWRRDGFRPSIEGAQLIQPRRNTIEISKEQLELWIRGFKLKMKTKVKGYCIITYKGEVVGSGKASNGKVWNYVPKKRRIKNLNY